jgi:hypothetical protein
MLQKFVDVFFCSPIPKHSDMFLKFKDLPPHSCCKPSPNPANASSFRIGHLSTYYTEILITAQQDANWHLFTLVKTIKKTISFLYEASIMIFSLTNILIRKWYHRIFQLAVKIQGIHYRVYVHHIAPHFNITFDTGCCPCCTHFLPTNCEQTKHNIRNFPS